MKTVLAVIIVSAIFAGAAYFGLPVILEKETGVLKAEIADLKTRLQGVEDFVKSEEEARKAGGLQPDAGFRDVVKTVNALTAKVNALESTLQKDLTARAEALKKQGAAAEEMIEKQGKTIDKVSRETLAVLRDIEFEAAMANIRGHILKTRMDLANRNIGTVKTELDLIHDLFEKGKSTASEEKKKSITELQGMLRKAKTEMDTDLPAAINRVDLLWYEMGKLLRKG